MANSSERITRPACLIVEVSDQAIRLLEGGAEREGFRATSCAEVPIPEGMDFSDTAQRNALRDRLRQAVRESCHVRDATVVLSEGLASVRTMTVPAAARASLRSIVELRVEAEMPIPLEQAAWGYCTWQDGRATGEVSVLLAVARAGEVRRRLSLLADAGLRPRQLRVGVLALREAYRRSAAYAAAGSVCLLSLGPDAATVAFLEDDRLRWCRYLRAGAGEAPWPALCRELRESIRYFTAERGGAPPQKLVAFGAGSRTPEFGRALADALGLEVSAAPAIAGFSLDAAEGGPETAADWAAAIGALLERLSEDDSGIDLLPSLARRPRRSEAERAARRSMAALALGIVLALALVANSLWMKAARLAMVGRALDEATARQPSSAPLERELSAASTVARERMPWLDVLREISQLAPPGVTLKHAALQKDTAIDLRGTAPDYQSVEQLARKLNGAQWLQRAAPTQMREAKGGVEFGISCRLRGRPGTRRDRE